MERWKFTGKQRKYGKRMRILSKKSEKRKYWWQQIELETIECWDRLKQGSQTQMDSGAAWNSKQDFAGRIEKVKKKLFKILCF